MNNLYSSFLVFLLINLTCFNSHAQRNSTVSDVNAVLLNAGENKSELEEVLNYFKNKNDTVGLKSAEFLISNMDIHQAVNYYWVDSSGCKIDFNEFSYQNFKESVTSFRQIVEKKGQLTPVPFNSEDIKTIDAKYLINNIEVAIKSWKNSKIKNIPFQIFCEYILPYRVTIEPIQKWRENYQEEYKWITDSLFSLDLKTVMGLAQIDYKTSFLFTWNKESRDEPLPRLGAKHLIFRKKGACEDVAAMVAFIFRSQGIPTAYDYIPLWGTSSGKHFLNTVFDADMNAVKFDITLPGSPVDHTLPREPAKVIRTTYSKQKSSLAFQDSIANIPPGFMQTQNYIDVTAEYWDTRDAYSKLYQTEIDNQVVYACMFSDAKWQPIWWGRSIGKNVVFKDMPKGTAILPAFFKGGNLEPAGDVRINGFNNELELKPDYGNLRNIIIEEKQGYLIFRTDNMYSLYIWDREWKLVNKQMYNDGSRTMSFENVPRNVLMVLVPEYSQGKERPFIITEDNARHWF